MRVLSHHKLKLGVWLGIFILLQTSCLSEDSTSSIPSHTISAVPSTPTMEFSQITPTVEIAVPNSPSRPAAQTSMESTNAALLPPLLKMVRIFNRQMLHWVIVLCLALFGPQQKNRSCHVYILVYFSGCYDPRICLW